MAVDWNFLTQEWLCRIYSWYILAHPPAFVTKGGAGKHLILKKNSGQQFQFRKRECSEVAGSSNYHDKRDNSDYSYQAGKKYGDTQNYSRGPNSNKGPNYVNANEKKKKKKKACSVNEGKSTLLRAAVLLRTNHRPTMLNIR